MSLATWEKRPPEEAHLFNPAICGLLIVEFVKEFHKAKSEACPFVLPFCAIAIALHGRTREALPGTTLTSLYTWRERNPDTLVGFADRVRSLRPVIQESVRFCIDRRALAISNDGGLNLGDERVSVSKKFENAMTPDARDCINTARMLGRWFAKAGTTSTILSAWGVKP